VNTLNIDGQFELRLYNTLYNLTADNLMMSVPITLSGATVSEWAVAELERAKKLALNPDVVLISSPSPEGNEVGETLKASGINVAYYNLGTVDDLLKTVNMIADIIGTDEARANAQKYVDFLNKAMSETKAIAAKAGKSVKTAYSRGARGLCGPNSMPGIWMSELGATNIGEALGITGFNAEVTAEDLLNQDPDIIFCESPQAQELLKDEKYAGLKAVQNGQTPIVPYGLACSGLATADNPIVWYFAANYLYPEEAHFDVEAIMKDFYKTFYNYDLTQAQLDAAFHK